MTRISQVWGSSKSRSGVGRRRWLVGLAGVALGGLAMAGMSGLIRIQTVLDGQGGVDGLSGSQGIVLAPDGNHVYATGSFDDAIAVFSRAADGVLTFLGATFDTDTGIDGLNAARGVAVSPDNKHVYVASLLDNAVTAFSRNSS